MGWVWHATIYFLQFHLLVCPPTLRLEPLDPVPRTLIFGMDIGLDVFLNCRGLLYTYMNPSCTLFEVMSRTAAGHTCAILVICVLGAVNTILLFRATTKFTSCTSSTTTTKLSSLVFNFKYTSDDTRIGFDAPLRQISIFKIFLNAVKITINYYGIMKWFHEFTKLRFLLKNNQVQKMLNKHGVNVRCMNFSLIYGYLNLFLADLFYNVGKMG